MSWTDKLGRRRTPAGSSKVMVTDHRQRVSEESHRTKTWRPVAIIAVLAICGGSGLAADVDFPQVSVGTEEMPVALPDIQDVSYMTSQAPAGGCSLAYPASRQWYDRLSLGGYGEMHANFTEGKDGDQFDLHRMVMFMGYEFTDWLTFNSELEVEHAFVADGDGEISFEQAYVEYAMNDCIHFRAGRVLAPIGIINQKHEPPTFNGVERPAFAAAIIPSTWSVDGIGVAGSLGPALKYQAYLATSLNGDLFDETSGIRKGRLKERGSLGQTAFTGRIDYFPFAVRPSPGFQTLRLGASTFLGGVDNGDQGNDPGVDATLQLVSADVEYSIKRFDFRGVVAYENIDGAENLHNHAASPENVASVIFGYYVEGAVHIFPQRWKCGRSRRADLVAFVRYDDFDTQYRMPSGDAANPAGDRTEWTYGLTYLPIPTLALKADYQVRDDATADGVENGWNLGVGFMF